MSVHHHKLPIVTDGLIFQVDAANGLGGNVTDTKNLVTPTEVGTFTNGASVVNDAYDFDGVNDYIDFGNDTAWDAATSTIEVWVYPEAGARTIYGRTYTASNDYYLICQIGGSGTEFIISSRNSVSDTRSWFSVVSPTFNAWNLLTITKVPDTTAANKYGVKMYINGVEDTGLFIQTDTTGDGVDQWANNTANLDATTFGAFKRLSIANFWDGQIANCKIYNKALTAAEISQNYEATKHNFE